MIKNRMQDLEIFEEATINGMENKNHYKWNIPLWTVLLH